MPGTPQVPPTTGADSVAIKETVRNGALTLEERRAIVEQLPRPSAAALTRRLLTDEHTGVRALPDGLREFDLEGERRSWCSSSGWLGTLYARAVYTRGCHFLGSTKSNYYAACPLRDTKKLSQMFPRNATQIQLNLTSDLRKWRAFVAIAELGSLTRAAIFLDTSQSHLSRHLNSLERDCKTRLFTRTGRGVTLSDVGARIFPIVKDLLSDAEQLETEIHGDALAPAGRVTIGLLPSIANAIAIRLFENMRERYPAIQLKVQEGSSGQVEEWVVAARVDVGILYRYSDVPLESEQALARIDSYLVGPAGDQLTSAPDVPFAALHELPFILPSAPNGLRAVLDRLSRLNQISLSPVIEADSLPLMRAGVAESGLYTVLPIHAVWSQVRENRLQAARIVSPEIRRIVSMVYSTNKGPARAVSAVTRQIAEIMENQGRMGVWG